MTGPAPLLRLHVVRKDFHAGPPVLRDISLSLGAREVVALLGPSGCGKTTLLRIVAGLDRDFTGASTWRDGAAPRLGMVFQQPLLLPWRTLRQNLRLMLPDGSRWGEAEALMRAFGLDGSLDALPASVSLGMARRAAMARALAVRPELLLLDEPFASLDAAAAARARAIVLASWRERPMAVLLVTHDAADAAALADRVLVLAHNPGRIAAEIVVPEGARRPGAESRIAEIAELIRSKLARPGPIE